MGDLFNREFRCHYWLTFPFAVAVSFGRSALTEKKKKKEKKFHPGDVAKSKEPHRSPRIVKRANSRRLPEINADNEGRGDGMSGDLNDIRPVGGRLRPDKPGRCGGPTVFGAAVNQRISTQSGRFDQSGDAASETAPFSPSAGIRPDFKHSHSSQGSALNDTNGIHSIWNV